MRLVCLIVATLAATVFTANAATVLCKARKGALAIRAQCKKNETVVDAAVADQLGFRGAPGPAGVGAKVVDSTGKDVGIYLASPYNGDAFLRQVGDDWLLFQLTGAGFQTSSYHLDQNLRFPTPDCTGTAYREVTANQLAAYVGTIQTDGKTAYFARDQEVVAPQLYYVNNPVFGADPGALAAQCTQGTVVGTAYVCPSAPSFYCLDCCKAFDTRVAAPVHTVDVSTFGLTPPFTLANQ